MAEIEASIAKVIEAYRFSVTARDVPAFMRLYDPSARVFDAWGEWSYETLVAWQIAIEGWFASYPHDRFVVTFDDVRSSSTPAFALVSAIVTYAVISREGAPLNSMQNRLSWVLRTSGHVPRIIHEHTSAPIGFDDQKAILQRVSKRSAST